MASRTKIQWADASWSPTTGCSKVSPGCANCYAERMAKRLKAMGQPGYADVVDESGWTGTICCRPEKLAEPLGWRKPREVFVGSMSDLFHEDVPYDFHLEVWSVFAKCPQHTFQLLTKRARRMAGVTRDIGGYDPEGRIPLSTRYRDFAENVWLGVSCETQATANARTPWLLRCPAAVRFVSLEPLLGPVELDIDWLIAPCPGCGRHEPYCDCDLRGNWPDHPTLDWVIVGGESGPGARPMHPEWVRSIRDQCVEAGVPFFFKGWGDWVPFAARATYDDGVVLGGDCGGPNCLSYSENRRLPAGKCVARGGACGEKGMLATVRRERTHGWGRDNKLWMEYIRVGKKRAGCLLDGRKWLQKPGDER